MESLYSATPSEALDERVKRKALVTLPFREGREVFGILREGDSHRVVDHFGD